MNIIFGSHLIDEIATKYTVLELDTIRLMPDDVESTAYCVVEKIPMFELDQLHVLKQLHNDMINYYKNRKWGACADAAQTLKGAWGTELDSFYDIMLSRVRQYLVQEPDSSWSPVIEKTQS
jgi:hypothetical protein